MKANSFCKQLPVFLGAKVGRDEAGPAWMWEPAVPWHHLHKTLLGEHQACHPPLAPCPAHPPERREAPFVLSLSLSLPTPPLFLSQVWKPYHAFARPRGARSWTGPAPKRGTLPCNQTTAFTESKSAMTALGNEPGKVIQER